MRSSRAPLAVLACLALLGVTLAACRDVLGLGGIREAACVGDCDGGDDGMTTMDSRSGPSDAADAGEAGCMPVSVEDGASACTLPEAGTCVPGPFDGGTWIPPRVNPSACTQAQVQAFLDACVGPNASGPACDSFSAGTDTASCYKCIISARTDKTWGAVIEVNFGGGAAVAIVDTGGCIYALDPCNRPCALAAELLAQCQFDSCDTGCTANSANACFSASMSCPCGGYEQAALDCLQVLQSQNSPASACALSGDFLSQVKIAALAMCSGGG